MSCHSIIARFTMRPGGGFRKNVNEEFHGLIFAMRVNRPIVHWVSSFAHVKLRMTGRLFPQMHGKNWLPKWRNTKANSAISSFMDMMVLCSMKIRIIICRFRKMKGHAGNFTKNLLDGSRNQFRTWKRRQLESFDD